MLNTCITRRWKEHWCYHYKMKEFTVFPNKFSPDFIKSCECSGGDQILFLKNDDENFNHFHTITIFDDVKHTTSSNRLRFTQVSML